MVDLDLVRRNDLKGKHVAQKELGEGYFYLQTLRCFFLEEIDRERKKRERCTLALSWMNRERMIEELEKIEQTSQ